MALILGTVAFGASQLIPMLNDTKIQIEDNRISAQNYSDDLMSIPKTVTTEVELKQKGGGFLNQVGSELGKGFSELNDPLDQRSRFEEQVKLREAGDKEAQRMDEDFVEALEYGMPPTAGFAYSERLFSFFVDKPIREVVFFPIMKPRE